LFPIRGVENQLKSLFLTEHSRLYKKCALFFKQTSVDSNVKFIDLIKHALKDDSRTREIFINLGWMNKEHKLTTSFRCIIEDSLLEKNLLMDRNKEDVYETSSQTLKNDR